MITVILFSLLIVLLIVMMISGTIMMIKLDISDFMCSFWMSITNAILGILS